MFNKIELKHIFVCIFICSALVYLAWYTIYKADATFQLQMAEEVRVIMIMAVGSALAYLGLSVQNKYIGNKGSRK